MSERKKPSDHTANQDFKGEELRKLVIDVESAVGNNGAGLTPLGIKIMNLCEDAMEEDTKHQEYER